MRSKLVRLVPITFTLSLMACATQAPPPAGAPGVAISSITVTSKAFGSGPIPVDFTCDGKDVSPPLTWSSPPEGTKSLVVLVDDPDATTLFTHWLVFDLPASATAITEGYDPASEGAHTALNDFRSAQYNGPCPPKGEVHRFRYRVIALDKVIDAHDGATHDAINRAMDQHILGEGALNATFGH